MNFKKFKDGILITVKVKPNSPKFSVELSDNKILISCKSPPKQNKANTEIIKELRRNFKNNVEIVSGLSSRNKKILIHGLTEQKFLSFLTKL
jgi:uncharacterized protein (TIGR00251 family)